MPSYGPVFSLPPILRVAESLSPLELRNRGVSMVNLNPRIYTPSWNGSFRYLTKECEGVGDARWKGKSYTVREVYDPEEEMFLHSHPHSSNTFICSCSPR